MLKEANQKILEQLKEVLQVSTNKEYAQKVSIADNNSIGDHVRHILDFYLCFLTQDLPNVSYDKRSRKEILSLNKEEALRELENIQNKINKLNTDQQLNLIVEIEGKQCKSSSSMDRELIYLLEHSIHHLAIIKIILNVNFPDIKVPENFGIAFSTLAFQDKNA